MLKTQKILIALAVLASAALSGCATTDGAAAAGPSMAERHQHMRDAKQGAAASTLPIDSTVARKPLHDHREMK
jgi:hypothetical protein